MKRVFIMLLFSFLAAGCMTYRGTSVVLEHHEDLSITQNEVNVLWKLVCDLTHTSLTLPPPQIYFETFNPLYMDPTWLAWQKGWMKEAKLDACPWGDTYEGYFYTGTAIIQIDPSFFLKETGNQSNPQVREDDRRAGKRVIAHEMLHYIFEQKGIPPYLHHCVMDQAGYDRAIMSFVYQKPIRHTSLEGICEKTPRMVIEQSIKRSQAPLEAR